MEAGPGGVEGEEGANTSTDPDRTGRRALCLRRYIRVVATIAIRVASPAPDAPTISPRFGPSAAAAGPGEGAKGFRFAIKFV
jgi:hypothetical protein